MLNNKTYTVDRIEDGIAVLYDEDEKKLDIAVTDLPENVKDIKEGDILGFDAEKNAYTIEKEKTAQVKTALEERLKKLFKK